MSELVEKRLAVASLNHPGAVAVPGDLRTTWPVVVDAFRERHGSETPTLLAGCPPCQGMSSARGSRGKENDPDAGSRDGRNLLVLPIASVAEELKPLFVVVENVPAFLRRKVRDPSTGIPLSAAKLLCDRLQADYRAFALLVDLCEYGVPQSRLRAFLTFVRRRTEALEVLERTASSPFPAPTHGGSGNPTFITIDHALAEVGLPPLDARTSESAVTADHPLHRVPVWDRRRYEMVAAIPPGSGGSAWDNECCGRCGHAQCEPTEAVCPVCRSPLLRPVVSNPDGSWRLVRGFRNSSYRRMDPTRPAATITTASGNMGSDRTIHPWENRVLSPAECAHLQTIPADFDWGDAIESWGVSRVRQMIGEAVPPRFTALHGRVLMSLSQNNSDVLDALPQGDARCSKADARLHA